jgi:hypothetical protein
LHRVSPLTIIAGAAARACTYDGWEAVHSTDFRKYAGISSGIAGGEIMQRIFDGVRAALGVPWSLEISGR